MNRIKYTYLRLLLALLPVIMAVAPAAAQITVPAGQSYQLSVVQVPGDVYTWSLYSDVNGIDFVKDPGNCPAASAYFTSGNTGSTVDVTWLKPGVYFYTVKAVRPGCSSNLKVGKMIVTDALPTATILPPTPVCAGEKATLTIELTGEAPWSIDVSDGTTTTTYSGITSSPFTLTVSPTATTSYTVTRVSDSNGENLIPSNTVTLVVKPRPVTSPIIQYGP
jgi:hypothetical protein